MLNAVKEVQENKIGMRTAARMWSVPKSSLQRRLKGKVAMPKRLGRHEVLGHKAEKELVYHLLKLESRGFGLTVDDVRHLAYQFAELNGIEHSFNSASQKAGYDWWYGFKKRHPTLAVRKAESLSTARAIGMNRTQVHKYFELLQSTVNDYELHDKPDLIFNADETGLTLCHQPGQIVSAKGKRNVYAATSGERGINTTVLCCVSASGLYIPPFIIFKGKRSNEMLKCGAPAGSLVTLSPSGYIDSDLFLKFLQHFQKQRPRTDEWCLLVVDGHGSHTKSVESLKFAESNKILLLCLPPHTTHILQPLDRCIFKTLKLQWKVECTKWMRKNPGKVITRYQFCGLFKSAWLKTSTPSNAESAFRATGIVPLNEDIIPPSAFEASETTNRPIAEMSASVCEEQQHSDNGLDVAEGVPSSTSQNDRASEEAVTNSGSNCETEPVADVSPAAPQCSTSEVSEEAVNKSGTNSNTEPVAGPSKVVTFADIVPLPQVAAQRSSRQKVKRKTGGRLLNADIAELEKQKTLKELGEKEKQERKRKRETKQTQQSNSDIPGIKKCKTKGSGTKTVRKLKVCRDKKPSAKKTPAKFARGYLNSDSDCPCAVCGELFSDSRPGEKWIHCVADSCENWAHELCTDGSEVFCCPVCEDDD